MPRVYRAMFAEEGRPKVGSSKKELGVKVGQDSNDDIAPDSQGLVQPGAKGMSVAPQWRSLPKHRIPQRLRPLCSSATGNDKLECWYMGEGSFETGSIADRLSLVCDREHHGVISPATPMFVNDFQAALAATRDQWSIVPETQRAGTLANLT